MISHERHDDRSICTHNTDRWGIIQGGQVDHLFPLGP